MSEAQCDKVIVPRSELKGQTPTTLAWPPPFFHCIVLTSFFFLKVGLYKNFHFTVRVDTKWGLIQRRIKGKKEGLSRLTLSMLSFLVVLLLSRPLLRGTRCKAKGCSTVKLASFEGCTDLKQTLQLSIHSFILLPHQQPHFKLALTTKWDYLAGPRSLHTVISKS